MTAASRVLCAVLLGGAVLTSASAGWSVHMADGREMAIVNNGILPGNQQLERRNPDGSPDLLFGRNGRVSLGFAQGDLGATSIRLDAQGRLLVAGSAMAPGDRAVPTSLRFLPDGRPDTSWGNQGRSMLPSPGTDAYATDVLPMDGELALMLGHVDADPTEQVALWLLRGDGSPVTGFGQGGVMRASGLEGARGLGLQRDNDGAALIALQIPAQGIDWLEVHRWQPGLEQPQRIARQPAPREWMGAITLGRRGGTWQWYDASLPSTAGGVPQGGVALAAVAATAVWSQASPQPPNVAPVEDRPDASPGHAAFNPFAVDSHSNAPADLLSAGFTWALIALGSLGALGVLAWWQFGRRS